MMLRSILQVRTAAGFRGLPGPWWPRFIYRARHGELKAFFRGLIIATRGNVNIVLKHFHEGCLVLCDYVDIVVDTAFITAQYNQSIGVATRNDAYVVGRQSPTAAFQLTASPKTEHRNTLTWWQMLSTCFLALVDAIRDSFTVEPPLKLAACRQLEQELKVEPGSIHSRLLRMYATEGGQTKDLAKRLSVAASKVDQAFKEILKRTDGRAHTRDDLLVLVISFMSNLHGGTSQPTTSSATSSPRAPEQVAARQGQDADETPDAATAERGTRG